MRVVDGNGLNLGFHLERARTSEVRLAERTLDTISVARPHGRPTHRPEKPVADRAYDSHALRCALRRRGIGMCIPAKRRPARWRAKRGRPIVVRKEGYRLRFTVERSFAWLGNYRRLLIRWERLLAVYASWFAVAVMRTCIRRLVDSSEGRRVRLAAAAAHGVRRRRRPAAWIRQLRRSVSWLAPRPSP